MRCAGFSLQWLLLLQSTGSRHTAFSSCSTQVQQLWCTGLVAPRHVGSSQTRDQTRVPCIGRQILNHCATREVPIPLEFWPCPEITFYWKWRRRRRRRRGGGRGRGNRGGGGGRGRGRKRSFLGSKERTGFPESNTAILTGFTFFAFGDSYPLVGNLFWKSNRF